MVLLRGREVFAKALVVCYCTVIPFAIEASGSNVGRVFSGSGGALQLGRGHEWQIMESGAELPGFPFAEL